MSGFKPDWDELEAARESLREHMKVTRDCQTRLLCLIDGLQEITIENTNCGTFNKIQKLCAIAKGNKYNGKELPDE